MRYKIQRRILAAIAGTLLALVIFPGCADKITGSSQQVRIAIALDAKATGSFAGTAVDVFRLTVEAPDMETIIAPLELQGTYLVGQVDVPLGRRRHFTAEALNSIGNFGNAGIVLYRGDTYADVLSAGTTELSLALYPVVPMIKLTPRFQNKVMGDSFFVDILAYGLPDVAEVSLTLSYNNSPLYINSIVKGSTMGPNSFINWSTATETVYLNAYTGDYVGSLTDSTGFAHLAQMQVNSYYDWSYDTATAVFSIAINQIRNLAGDSISLSGIYTDGATVFMQAPLLSQTAVGGLGNEAAYAIVADGQGGAIAAGYTNSYGSGSDDAYVINVESRGHVVWEKTFGGSLQDGAKGIAWMADGGLVMTGYSYSSVTRSNDVLLVKMDGFGNAAWQKSYGGPLNQGGHAVLETFDGGCLITGYSTTISSTYNDVFLMKTDTGGVSLWQKNYGGAAADEGHAVCPASDGGYIIVGDTYSFGAGGADIYMLKVNDRGDMLWQKNFGGTADERGSAMAPTRDGGYIIAGRTFSYGAGLNDLYLVKTDVSGNKLWDKALGGTGNDEGCAVAQTADGGYVVAGFTNSFGAGNFDAYLIKTDATGNKVWENAYGGSQDDGANCLVPAGDGGFILAGWTNSFGNGGDDMYLVKVDSLGNTPQ